MVLCSHHIRRLLFDSAHEILVLGKYLPAQPLVGRREPGLLLLHLLALLLLTRLQRVAYLCRGDSLLGCPHRRTELGPLGLELVGRLLPCYHIALDVRPLLGVRAPVRVHPGLRLLHLLDRVLLPDLSALAMPVVARLAHLLAFHVLLTAGLGNIPIVLSDDPPTVLAERQRLEIADRQVAICVRRLLAAAIIIRIVVLIDRLPRPAATSWQGRDGPRWAPFCHRRGQATLGCRSSGRPAAFWER